MDTVTQVALGATIGEAGFRGRLGGKAPLLGGFCALLPDLDILIGLNDPWLRLLVHRGSSHSLIVLPAAALLVGGLGRWWGGVRGTYPSWVHLCFWALMTHPLLDATTTYGTQLLAPLSRSRFAIDAMSIIDPVYSLPLFVACVLAARRKGSRRTSRRFAWGALAFTTAYIGLGFFQSQRAVDLASNQLRRDGFDPVEVRALPTLLNNQAFRVVARDAAGDLRIGYVSMLVPGPIDFMERALPDHPALSAVLWSRKGGRFEWFAMGMISAEVSEDGREVVLGDQRYGLITRPAATFFRARFRLNELDRVVEAERLGRDLQADFERELAALWELLRGNGPPARAAWEPLDARRSRGYVIASPWPPPRPVPSAPSVALPRN